MYIKVRMIKQMNNKNYIIAVDGPSGAGKSTVCTDVAKILGILHLDTGATYRTLALGLMNRGVDIEDAGAVEVALDSIEVEIGFEDGKQIMYLDGKDVTAEIRTNEVSQAASKTSVIGRVREKLVQLQRDTAKRMSMLVDGRDICTCVFPDAEYKFYLTADAAERARRRQKQLAQQGIECDLAVLEKEIEERDYRDMHRDISPLVRAQDAVLVDGTHMTQQGVVEYMLGYIKEKRKTTMNETIKTLTTRKSCRSYKPVHVEKELLEQIIDAGLNAPSGRNMQTPRFVVVSDDATVERLSRMNAAVFNMPGDPFYGARDVIIVLVKKECTYIYDGSLAMGNLMNAAWALGVDSRWIHRAKEVFESEEGKALLKQWGVEDDVEGIGFCILGYAEEEKEKTEIQSGRVFYV